VSASEIISEDWLTFGEVMGKSLVCFLTHGVVSAWLCNSAVGDSPWILAKQRRDRKIPYSALDGYGTVKYGRDSPRGATSHTADDRDEPSPLFLPSNDANFVMPSVGDKSVTRTILC